MRRILHMSMCIGFLWGMLACDPKSPTGPTPEMIPGTSVTPPVVDGIPGGPGVPSITFISVPEYGTRDNLIVQVLHVEPAQYKIAFLIKVEGSWWSKPTFAQPAVPIPANGMLTIGITPGGSDVLATEIAAFVVPVSFNPPVTGPGAVIPPLLEETAVAHAYANRAPRLTSITFSGYDWLVKNSFEGLAGPGPNRFSNNPENVFVDNEGRLHLKISHRNLVWYSAEVILNRSLGYGQYAFELEGGFESMDSNAVLGLFTWDTGAPPFFREMDIEFSRWSNPGNDNGQFVIQPFNVPSNIHRFNFLSSPVSRHQFKWTSGRVEFLSQSPAQTETWVFNGSGVPTPGQENVRLNLWLFNGRPPSSGSSVEVVIRNFRFTPL